MSGETQKSQPLFGRDLVRGAMIPAPGAGGDGFVGLDWIFQSHSQRGISLGIMT